MFEDFSIKIKRVDGCEYFHGKLNYVNTIKFKLNEYHSFVNDGIRRCTICVRCVLHHKMEIFECVSAYKIHCIKAYFVMVSYCMVWCGIMVWWHLRHCNCKTIVTKCIIFWDAPHTLICIHIDATNR